jgi:hypothetical protein
MTIATSRILAIAVMQVAIAFGTAATADSLTGSQIRGFKKSVGLITCKGASTGLRTASGFLILRPGDDKPVIITCGHVLEGGPDVSATFLGRGNSCPCALIDFSDELDLMVLAPTQALKVPPLTIGDLQLDEADILCLLCYRDKYPAPYHSFGEFRLLTTASTLPLLTAFGNTNVIMHGTSSVDGKSGGPLLRFPGVVVGVHNSREGVDGQCESFAVSAKHLIPENNGRTDPLSGSPLKVLDLYAKPDLSCQKGIDKLKVHLQSLAQKQSSKSYSFERPLQISLDGEQLDVQFTSDGYVIGDATDVARKCFRQTPAFLQEFGLARLQQILTARKLVRLVNPAFGFDLLVPSDWTAESTKLTSSEGIKLTVRLKDDRTSYNTFTVQAFIIPEALALLADRKVTQLLGQSPNDSVRKQLFSVKASEAMNVAFPTVFLGLRVRSPNTGQVIGENRNSDIFSIQGLDDPTRPTVRFQDNLFSESSDLSYALDGKVFGDVVLVSYFCFKKPDLDNYRAGRQPSASFMDQVLMTSSVSFH